MNQNGLEQIFPLGEPNDAYARYFIGQSHLALLAGGSVPVSNVTFEPGCRNNWHIHHGTDGGGDQILLCTAGSGWYQADGEEPISMEPGSVIRVPAGTRHWHGAKADSWFSHIAFITPGEGVSNEWLEPVADELYKQLARSERPTEKVTAGHDALGDFAPTFAALNDDVLFGQIWSREEQLSPATRSIITVTALMSGSVLDGSLQHHIERARANGVTAEEMAEVLTHAAFYAGWPKAWAAFRLAKEVYGA